MNLNLPSFCDLIRVLNNYITFFFYFIYEGSLFLVIEYKYDICFFFSLDVCSNMVLIFTVYYIIFERLVSLDLSLYDVL